MICIPTYDRPDSICDFVHQTATELAIQNVVIILALGENWLGRSGWQKWRATLDQAEVAQAGSPVTISLFQFLPFRRFGWIRRLNAAFNFWYISRFLRYTHREPAVLWMFNPRECTLVKFFRDWQIHFDCVDWHSSADPVIKKQIDQQREYIFQLASTVTCITQPVQDRIKLIRRATAPIVPQGFDLEGFRQVSELPEVVTAQLKALSGKKVVGFFGGLNQRLDLDLLTDVISRSPHLVFLFVGPRGMDENVSQSAQPEQRIDELLKLSNVVWIPNLKRNQLLPVMKLCTVLTIPYDLRWEFNYCCFPMKVMEYFYAAKPILSTPIPSLLNYPTIAHADNAEDWLKQLQKLLTKKLTTAEQRSSQAIAISQTWQKKLDSVDVYLAEMLRSS